MSVTEGQIHVNDKSEIPSNSETNDNNSNNGDHITDINKEQNLSSTDMPPQINLSSINEEVSNVRKQYSELESILGTQLKSNNASLAEFLKTLRIISHNQEVLENKLEDAMKNQMNTDILVNNMNQRLNFLSDLLNSKSWKKPQSSKQNNNNFSVSKDGSNKMVTSEYNNINNRYSNIENGNGTYSRRGPGRPRKDSSRFINNDFKSLESSHTNELSSVNISLPTGTVQVSKSKRYFIDPTDSNNPSMSPALPTSTSSDRKSRSRGRPKRYDDDDDDDDDDSDNNSENSNEAESDHSDSDTNQVSTPSKRKERNQKKIKSKVKTEETGTIERQQKRRGRPPKLRTVDTVITNSSNTRTNTNGSDQSQHLSIPSVPDIIKFEKDSSVIDDESQQDFKVLDNNEEKNDSKRTSSVKDHNNKINIPITKTFLYRKQSDQAKDHSSKDKHIDENNFDKQPLEDKKQQMKLDKLRDSREKMLTSLKYNDRARAKSFMDSNKELLMALKLEEKRKRLSSNYEYTLPFPGKDEEGENNQAKDEDKPAKEAEPLSKEMITDLVQNNFTEGSDDMVHFGEDKTEFLSSLLSSEPYTKGTSQHLSQDDKSEEQAIEQAEAVSPENSNEGDVETEGSGESEIEPDDSKKATRERPRTTKVEVNCPYNLRTKRKLVDPNSIDDTKTIEPTDREPVKKARSSPPEKISDAEAKLNAKRFLTNRYLMLEKDLVRKDKRTENTLDTDSTGDGDVEDGISSNEDIELICKDGFFYSQGSNEPITSGVYLKYKFRAKEQELLGQALCEEEENKLSSSTNVLGSGSKYDRSNVHFVQTNIEQETEFAFTVLSKTTLTQSYVNSLEYFIMEFRWENKLVAIGLKLRESKRTWQRRKALFTLFDFWRDQSIEKRNFPNYSMLHAIKEMENYRIFINRSVSWFYNHITLLKMILYDLCDNVDTQWRDWMFPKDKPLPVIGGYDEATQSPITVDNINAVLDRALVFDLLDDGTLNNGIKQSQVVAPKVNH